MKKNILAIAIATAVAAPVAMADAPTVYGQFNLAIESVTENGMTVNHRNSRLGVKGSEDLGNGLKAVYQMEGTISYGDFKADRNTFAGLAGGFGTVVMGRHDTPMRMIQPSDAFNDSSYAGNNTGNFNGFNRKDNNASGEDRVNQVVAYLSPNFNGISFAAALVSTQDDDDAALTNATSFNVQYGSKRSGLYAAAGMTSVQATQNGSAAADKDERDNMRVTVQYNEGGMLGYVMYNSVTVGQDFGDELTTDAAATKNIMDGSSITLGGAYKMGVLTPRAKLAMITYDNKTAANDTTNNFGKDSSMSMALGVDYALGKNTKVYAEYATLDKNNRAVTVNTGAGTDKKDVTVMSVGLFHKF